MKRGISLFGEFLKGILTLFVVGFVVFLLAFGLTSGILQLPMGASLSIGIVSGTLTGAIAGCFKALRDWIFHNFYLPDLPF